MDTAVDKEKRLSSNATDALFLFLLATTYGLITAGSLFTGVFFIHFQHDLNASASQASLAIGLPVAALFLGGPLYSMILDVLGYKRSLVLASLLVGVGYMLTGVAPSIELVQLFMGMLIGAGAGICSQASYTVIGKLFLEKRSFANSVMSTAGMLVTLCLAPVSQIMMDLYSWRWTMILTGAFLLNAISTALLSAWFYRTDCERAREGPDERMSAEYGTVDEEIGSQKPMSDEVVQLQDESFSPTNDADLTSNSNMKKSTFRKKLTNMTADFSALRDGGFLCYMFSASASSTSIACPRLYLVRYAQDIGVDDAQAVWLFSISRGLYMVTCLLMGTVMSYFKGRKTFKLEAKRETTSQAHGNEPFALRQFVMTRSDFLGLFLMLTAFSLVIPTIWESYGGFLAYAVIGGICTGCVGVMPITVLTDLFGTEKLSTLLGYRSFLTGVFTLVFPPFIGHLIDVFGTYKTAQYVCGILAVFSCGLILVSQYLVDRRDLRINRI